MDKLSQEALLLVEHWRKLQPEERGSVCHLLDAHVREQSRAMQELGEEDAKSADAQAYREEVLDRAARTMRILRFASELLAFLGAE